jgi:HD superfamily phosphohydrolase
MSKPIPIALREGFSEAVRDAIWGHIAMTPALKALTGSAPFRRLSRILQLGPVSAVYPGATHTRAAHSLGVYHLARRMLLRLAGQGAGSRFSAEGAYSFLCAALLHDLGHFPYTHSLKELPLASHESLTAALILQEPLKTMVGAAGADPCFTAAIVDPRSAGGPGAAPSGELDFYRNLLSGCLDPDKLDYLNRDARYCGVPYGVQDVDYILRRLRPHPEGGIALDARGIPCVESILFAKYLMYRTVYWHPQVRSATAMIKKAILGGLQEGCISREDLYHLDDPGLFALLDARRHRLFPLVQQVRDGLFYETAAEFPFDPALHQNLLPIERRCRYEQALAGELSRRSAAPIPSDHLIIDIPEPLTFETGLYVLDEACYFPESSSIFNAQTSADFIKSLRIIRIFIAPGHGDGNLRQTLTELLHIPKNWLQ